MIYQYRYKTPENFSNMLMNSDGEKLNFTPPYQIKNLTPFRQEVIDMNENILFLEMVQHYNDKNYFDRKRNRKEGEC